MVSPRVKHYIKQQFYSISSNIHLKLSSTQSLTPCCWFSNRWMRSPAELVLHFQHNPANQAIGDPSLLRCLQKKLDPLYEKGLRRLLRDRVSQCFCQFETKPISQKHLTGDNTPFLTTAFITDGCKVYCR